MPASLVELTASAYSYPLLIKQLLLTPLANAPEQEIIYRDHVRYNYRTLNERICRLGNVLETLGVEPGQTVAVMDWDSHRYLECFFGVPMSGAVLQTVNVRLSPEQILYTLNHARADVLLVNAEFVPMLAGIRDQLTTVKQFVLLTDGGDMSAFGIPYAGEYEALLAAASPEHEFPDFDENTRATTFYTTGTTGQPKGVYFSHRQLVMHTLGVGLALGSSQEQGRLHRGDVYMPITPMFHVHAWGLPYLATLLGLKQVYPGRYVPEALLRLIRTEKVTFSHCVPTVLQMLLASPSAREMDFSGWKVIIGGSSLSCGLTKAALERGIDLFTGYGMSETCPILTFAHVDADVPDDDLERQLEARGKTGQALPLVDLRIVDERMRDVPHDGRTPGELVARAPWLTGGYLHNPDASETLWQGGYLHTGDIGNIDACGRLKITDRVKDVIKVGGEWISSLEIESIISRHPAVAEVAVVAIADSKWGERPLAAVVLKPDLAEPVSEDDIQHHLKHFVDGGAIPRLAILTRVRFTGTLAKTSVGKLNKMHMREEFSAA